MALRLLKKVLHSLACGKHEILVKAAGGDAEEESNKKSSSVIKPTDFFRVNTKFSSPQVRFKVPMPSLESNAATAAQQNVDGSRVHQIEAAIVRTMKARKTMNHATLVSEVLGQLSLFKPEPKAIKKSIESLIEREYIERSADAPNMYNYLA